MEVGALDMRGCDIGTGPLLMRSIVFLFLKGWMRIFVVCAEMRIALGFDNHLDYVWGGGSNGRDKSWKGGRGPVEIHNRVMHYGILPPPEVGKASM